MMIDEKAVVLDFLPRGKSTSFKPQPIAQIIGTEFFTLLEVVSKPGVELKAGSEVYIGKGERKEIEFIKRRISYKDLTSNSAAEIDKVVEALVRKNESKFVDFFNTSRSISIKMHQIELLPGLGKKHMLEIIKQREAEPFKSFADISNRVHLMPDPVKTIVKRVIEELSEDEQKYYLFAKPMPKPEAGFSGRQGGFRPKRFEKRY